MKVFTGFLLIALVGLVTGADKADVISNDVPNKSAELLKDSHGSIEQPDNSFQRRRDSAVHFVPFVPLPVKKAVSKQSTADELIGSEEAAKRVVSAPLFFDTVDHGHIVVDYVDRRRKGGNAAFPFRSIRYGFPFSDVTQ